MSYKTRPDEDDGFEQIIPLCREYTLSPVNPQSRAFEAIPGGTLVGPVIEVQIVEILCQYGLEIAIPSPTDRQRTSYGMISRGKSQFVDEVHIPNAELRSSAELLTALHKAEGGESCLGPSAFSPAKRLVSNKEPFLRPRGSGKLFLPILRMEELCQ